MKAKNAAAILIMAALILSGCSDNTSNPAESTSTSTPPSFPTLPVGEAFDTATWGAQAEPHSEPVITENRVIALVGTQVHAWDPAGQQAWTAQPELVGEPTEEPVLRMVSSETVAVITSVESEGEGLDTSGYASTVTLLNVETGETVITADVSGSETDLPRLSKYGLAFMLPDGSGLIITPSGQTHEVPGPLAGPPVEPGQTTTAIGTVGDTVITAIEADASGAGGGFESDNWSTADLGLVENPTGTRIDAVDQAMGQVLITAVSKNREDVAEATALVQADSGEIVMEVECSPITFTTFQHSPNGEHRIAGPLLISGTQATCIGGGAGQQEVTLTALSDDGTAYGRASEGELVTVSLGGEPETLPLPDSADAPIGVLEGNIAVHWDGASGVITGNPIKR